MNKYEKLFQTISHQTVNKKLKWKQISKTAHADLIYKPHFVCRQFSTEYQKDDAVFEVVLIEKQYDEFEFDISYEKTSPEILVIDDENELLVTLTDSLIEKSEMLKLIAMLENGNSNQHKNRLFD